MFDNDIYLNVIDSYKMSKNGFIVDFSKKKKDIINLTIKPSQWFIKRFSLKKEEYYEKR